MTDKLKADLNGRVCTCCQTVIPNATSLQACLASVVNMTHMVQRIQGVSQCIIPLCGNIRISCGISPTILRIPWVAVFCHLDYTALTLPNSLSKNMPVATVNVGIVNVVGTLTYTSTCIFNGAVRAAGYDGTSRYLEYEGQTQHQTTHIQDTHVISSCSLA